MLKLDKIFAIISNITAIATNKISKTSGKKAKTVSIAIEMAKNIISTKKERHDDKNCQKFTKSTLV